MCYQPFLEKMEDKQAKEKELAEAKHKLSQKEQEIETMRKEVSLVCLCGYGHLTHSSMQKTDLEQAKVKKEQEIETIRKEVSLVCEGL